MPIYEYECPSCRCLSEVVCRYDEKPLQIICKSCRMCYANPIISRPAAIKPDWEPYIDENLCPEPVVVKGRGHRRELMKQQGLQEADMSPQRKKEVLQKLRHIKRTGEIQQHKLKKERAHGR